jgi:hypothetical protein
MATKKLGKVSRKKRIMKNFSEVTTVAPPPVPEEAKVLSQIERIAQLANSTNALKYGPEVITGLYTHFSAMTTEELTAKLKSKTITALEKSIIVNIAKINTTGKDSMSALEYMHERIFGKMENKTSITGANGGPIQIQNKNKEVLEAKLSQMSDEELEKFEKNLSAMEALLGDEGNES